MARAILVKRGRHALAWLTGLVVIAGVDVAVTEPASGPQSPCAESIPGAKQDLQKPYQEFRHSVEHGPFYRAMARNLGSAPTCSAEIEQSAIVLKYGFPRGVSLEARRDPSIELSEQRLTVIDLDKARAVGLLRRAERDSFSSAGCGIAWSRPPSREAGSAPEAQDLVYRGNTCSCQGRLVYEKGKLVALVFRSAC